MTERVRLSYEHPYAYAELISSSLSDPRFAVYRAALGEVATYDKAKRATRLALADVKGAHARLKAEGFTVELTPQLRTSLDYAALCAAREKAEASARIAQRERVSAFRLYPFQKVGVAWLAPRKTALLADCMGLGKTATALLAMPEDAPTLIVAPLVALGVWEGEIAKWLPSRAVVRITRKQWEWPTQNSIALVSADSLPQSFSDVPPNLTVIADEAHLYKTPTARRTRNFRTLRDAALGRGGRVWLLTGTPLLNSPDELWHVLRAAALEKRAFGSWESFQTLFGATAGRFGGFTYSTTPDASVPERLATVCLRRTREEVLPDLPAKTYLTVPAPVDRATLYACDAALKVLGPDFLDRPVEEALRILQQPLAFQTWSTIRQTLAVAKIPTMLAYVESFEAQHEPLVVFSAHRAPVLALVPPDRSLAAEPLRVRILGDTPTDLRTKFAASFQAGTLHTLAGTIDAMGVSLTLTRAAHALFVDREATPALNEQAEDRLCRIGQKRAVVIHQLIADHPLDARLTAILTRKTELIGAVHAR